MIDKEKCKKCIHGDGLGNCVTKEESPFGEFVCKKNEKFEYDYISPTDNERMSEGIFF